MNTGLLVAINALWAVTLWLALPCMLRGLLGSRVARLQLAVIRTVLFGAPVIAVLACTSDLQRAPWVVWSGPQEPALLAATDAGVAELVAEPVVQVPAAAPVSLRRPLPEGFMPTPVTARTIPAAVDSRARLQSTRAAPLTVPLTVPPPVSLPVPAADPAPHTVTALPSTSATVSVEEKLTELSWPQQNLTTSLLALYLLGVAWGLIRHAWLHAGLWRLRRQWQPVGGEPGAWFAALARASGIRVRVPLLAAPALGNAAATGILRPAVVIPATWLENLERSELEPLLLHEFAHLRTRDPLMKTLWALARALCWPHPLVHWLARRDAYLSELVADAHVLERGCSRRDYARLLVQLIEDPPSPRPLVVATGFLGPRGALEGRIRMILDRRSHGPVARWGALLLATVPVVLLGWLLAHPLVGGPDEPQSGEARATEDALATDEALSTGEAPIAAEAADKIDAVNEDTVAAYADAPIRFENIDGYWHIARLDSKGRNVWQQRLCSVRHGWPKVLKVTPQLQKGEVTEQALVQIGSDDLDEVLTMVIDLEHGYVDEMKLTRRAPGEQDPLVGSLIGDLDQDGIADLFVANATQGTLQAQDLRAGVKNPNQSTRELALNLRQLAVAEQRANLQAHVSELEAAAVDLARLDLDLVTLQRQHDHGLTSATDLAAARARIADARALLDRRQANLKVLHLNVALAQRAAAGAQRIGELMVVTGYNAANNDQRSLTVELAPLVATCEALAQRVTDVERLLQHFLAGQQGRTDGHALGERARDRAAADPARDAIRVDSREFTRWLLEEQMAAQTAQDSRNRDPVKLDGEVGVANTRQLHAQLKAREARIATLEAQLKTLQRVVEKLQEERTTNPDSVR